LNRPSRLKPYKKGFSLENLLKFLRLTCHLYSFFITLAYIKAKPCAENKDEKPPYAKASGGKPIFRNFPGLPPEALA